MSRLKKIRISTDAGNYLQYLIMPDDGELVRSRVTLYPWLAIYKEFSFKGNGNIIGDFDGRPCEDGDMAVSRIALRLGKRKLFHELERFLEDLEAIKETKAVMKLDSLKITMLEAVYDDHFYRCILPSQEPVMMKGEPLKDYLKKRLDIAGMILMNDIEKRKGNRYAE